MYKHISIKPICIGWSQTSNPSCYCCLLHLRGYALALAKEYTGQLLQIYIYICISGAQVQIRDSWSFCLYYLGLKKWISMPMVTMLHTAPVTKRTLKTIPMHPSPQLRYQITLYFWGCLICIHMKQGYAKVTGNATPPISPAKLGKNGSATAMKKTRHPKKARNPERSHHGHGWFLLLIYLNSRLSNAGIAYIWNEVRLLITMSRLVKPRIILDVSCPW